MKLYEILVSRNVRLEAGIFPKPPFIENAMVAGDICFGLFGRCALCLLKGQDHAACGPTLPLLRMNIIAGFGTRREDNFFHAKLNGQYNVNKILEILELPTVCAMLYVVCCNV